MINFHNMFVNIIVNAHEKFKIFRRVHFVDIAITKQSRSMNN